VRHICQVDVKGVELAEAVNEAAVILRKKWDRVLVGREAMGETYGDAWLMMHGEVPVGARAGDGFSNGAYARALWKDWRVERMGTSRMRMLKRYIAHYDRLATNATRLPIFNELVVFVEAMRELREHIIQMSAFRQELEE
jgi:hypothetical protein